MMVWDVCFIKSIESYWLTRVIIGGVLAGYDRWPRNCDLQYKKVGNTFQIKIADFGLSALKPKKSASLVWEKVGTVNTMAPEILQVSYLVISSLLFGSYASQSIGAKSPHY